MLTVLCCAKCVLISERQDSKGNQPDGFRTVMAPVGGAAVVSKMSAELKRFYLILLTFLDVPGYFLRARNLYVFLYKYLPKVDSFCENAID